MSSFETIDLGGIFLMKVFQKDTHGPQKFIFSI